ncbi:hypothetical protein T4B_3480 [Trichinella pseudospiralis]|uniref:Uncharacterized protein n=2 Tax=Trichinella pseudospiralis TaxID=6337 RepID=A0A0V1JA02_TRIPS|nr:hypothetical protein T4D_15501 [Trichinella pseudospiralis]KRZ31413.1 hypothetical protein T4B_3480 [Trichinella pseudospiralis]
MPTFSRASSHLAHVRRRYSSRAGSQYNKSVRDRRLYFWNKFFETDFSLKRYFDKSTCKASAGVIKLVREDFHIVHRQRKSSIELCQNYSDR